MVFLVCLVCITERVRLEETSGAYLFQPSCSRRTTFSYFPRSVLAFEFLQEWRLQSLHGQPGLMIGHCHNTLEYHEGYSNSVPLMVLISVLKIAAASDFCSSCINTCGTPENTSSGRGEERNVNIINFLSTLQNLCDRIANLFVAASS